ncbi:RNA methyltransferase, TrmH family, group 3 [Thermodesulfatator indicus DSM 15286]|uniref:RNA methyltransferase, TrmH family, group 3 n=1 Tax=Thermodesulfatator indicus (strain DSM 15286 / JCM 11887 / CIR29812) TaxID=667014 RepID=F8A8G3_THEID|nr:23S rRNA (guanosine(2251)-2'-O)-methyltransferase RlmB [Thermodesulfatator indicus]AEH43969.1 RNA methyltransferase, TrmH family, group 3 [Thermodesulfatator indicus DSM 15286]
MPEVIWGINPVLELLRTNPSKIKEIYIQKKELKGRVYQIVERARKKDISVKIKKELTGLGLPPEVKTQGVVAVVKDFDYVDLEDILEKAKKSQELGLIVAVDGLTDPQNLGSLIRSAVAAGAHGLIIPERRAAGITGTVVKASAGAISHLLVHQAKNLGRTLEELKERNFWIAGLEARTKNTIYQLDLKLPLVWVVGSEEKGLRPSIKEKCDFLASIPMRGPIDSLNAAVAGAIALFETQRQRYHS